MKTPLLELKNITKAYGNLIANKDINLSIQPNSIHALLGENGAGKSTLVNTVYGIVSPDSGEIYWQGKKVEINSPIIARNLGVGIVFQHFALFPSLSILENIALGIGYTDKLSTLQKEVEEIMAKYRVQITNLQRPIGHLSAGEKQRVEIVRCLMQKPKLLILDEPTSVLTPLETANLFETLEVLRKSGCAILFIGHKLNEIKAVCETATIIRKGEWVGDYQLSQVRTDEIAELMVGNTLPAVSNRKPTKNPKVIFQFNHNGNIDFEATASYSENLQLKSGTITGLAGIAGNGQDQLMSYLSGETSGNKESIEYYDFSLQELTSESATAVSEFIGHLGIVVRNKKGVLYVPTERLGRSSLTQMNLIENAFLGIADKSQVCQGGLIDYKKVKQFSEDIIQEYDVQPPRSEALASSFSGGNLQKYIVGRAILQNPKVLLISNPTWGVDISAATFIRNRLIELRDLGMAIFVASEDLDEMFAICDEIAVIKQGKLSKAEKVEELTIEKVGMMMMA
jgi:simple sugar transport system ATP-binding protein